MSGVRSGAYSLLLVPLFSLCSATSWAEEYTGPALPPGWYPISENELTELDEILTRQSETIERQRSTLETLSTTIDEQETTMRRLRQSWTEYEQEVTETIRRQTIEIWVYRVGGIMLAGVAVWSLLQ